MKHSIDFFKDEVRNGFYIPTAIKQGWAAELDVLAEIDRICQNHGIKYFADWGTFLGAVRHGGFVPWDDDLDICMLRDDYTRFRKYADSELPKEFVFHDFERKQDHWLFLSKVVINSKICFEEDYLEEHNNFPWLAGVDIFVKDYLYEDDKKELRRDKDVMRIIAVADGIVNGDLTRQAVDMQINMLRKQFFVKFPAKYRLNDLTISLYKLAEQQMSKVSSDETDKVGQIFPWILKDGPKAGELKSVYDEFIRLPFEDTTIPVPAAYGSVLESRYRDYYTVRKVWTGHDYPFFESQKEELEKLSGEAFPSFSFESGMLRKQPKNIGNSLKSTSQQCLKELHQILDEAIRVLKEELFDDFTQAIADSQQLAADFGTLIEYTKGEERDTTKNVIAALQGYCDALWEEYQEISNGSDNTSLKKSITALEDVSEKVKINILNRKEILFLPTGSKEWRALEPYYRHALSDDSADVFVVPLMLYKKNFFGSVTMTDEEIELQKTKETYPQELDIFDCETYDLSIHCPDTIYFQNPYDETNPCLTVLPEFYAKNMKQYTDNLVYVPIAYTADFNEEDINDQYNLRHYLLTPGIVYADLVIAGSKVQKEQYVSALSSFAGESTRSMWQEKIVPCDNETVEYNPLSTNPKKVMYCIGANELIKNSNTIVESVKTRFESFDKYREQLNVDVLIYPFDREQWNTLNSKVATEIFDVVNNAINKENCNIITPSPLEADTLVNSYEAYYGSPSPFVLAFSNQNKPVMLAEYSIK